MDELDAIAQALQGTCLEGKEIAVINGEGFPEIGYAINAENVDYILAWNELRGKIDQLGRWPIISSLWSNGGYVNTWQDVVDRFDFFNRWPFLQEGSESVVPKDIINRSYSVVGPPSPRNESAMEYLDFQLMLTERDFGKIPKLGDNPKAFLQQRKIYTEFDLEKWLAQWETENFGEISGEQLPLWDPRSDMVTLILLPITNPEECLAYIEFYGRGGETDSAATIAELRSWRKTYGAELVAHYGTMLEFFVSKPPSNIDEALELAQRHNRIAECTLSSVSTMRSYARGLLKSEGWHLHERP